MNEVTLTEALATAPIDTIHGTWYGSITADNAGAIKNHIMGLIPINNGITVIVTNELYGILQRISVGKFTGLNTGEHSLMISTNDCHYLLTFDEAYIEFCDYKNYFTVTQKAPGGNQLMWTFIHRAGR